MNIDRWDVLLVLSLVVMAIGLYIIHPATLLVAVGWVGLVASNR